MALKILTNQAWRDAAQISITDSSFAEVTADQTKALNVVGGHRGLAFSSSTTGDRIITYINKSGNLAADTMVAVGASAFNGHQVKVQQYTTYTSSVTDIFSTSNFAETLIGYQSTDWVYEFSAVSTKQALALYLGAGTGGAYTKTIGQVYFCNALSLSYPADLVVQPLPLKATVQLAGVPFGVMEKFNFKFNGVSATEAQSLTNLYKKTREPIFIYDSNGDWVFDKLLHCVVGAVKIGERFDDLHDVSLEVYRLNHSLSYLN